MATLMTMTRSLHTLLFLFAIISIPLMRKLKILFGGFIMGKVFTWLFGAITGFITGVTLIAWSMVVRPKEFVKVAESFIEE